MEHSTSTGRSCRLWSPSDATLADDSKPTAGAAESSGKGTEPIAPLQKFTGVLATETWDPRACLLRSSKHHPAPKAFPSKFPQVRAIIKCDERISFMENQTVRPPGCPPINRRTSPTRSSVRASWKFELPSWPQAAAGQGGGSLSGGCRWVSKSEPRSPFTDLCYPPINPENRHAPPRTSKKTDISPVCLSKATMAVEPTFALLFCRRAFRQVSSESINSWPQNPNGNSHGVTDVSGSFLMTLHATWNPVGVYLDSSRPRPQAGGGGQLPDRRTFVPDRAPPPPSTSFAGAFVFLSRKKARQGQFFGERVRPGAARSDTGRGFLQWLTRRLIFAGRPAPIMFFRPEGSVSLALRMSLFSEARCGSGKGQGSPWAPLRGINPVWFSGHRGLFRRPSIIPRLASKAARRFRQRGGRVRTPRSNHPPDVHTPSAGASAAWHCATILVDESPRGIFD